MLRPHKPFTKPPFLGRAAHKLFFLMLGQAGYPALAETLHNLNGPQPFTVSDLFQSDVDGTHYWLRVSGLEPHICEPLMRMVQVLPGAATVDGWAVVFGAKTQHEWAGQSTYQDFVDAHWHAPPRQQVTLEFATPTAIKSVGLYRPFPDPGLVFRLLYERLQRVDGLRLPFEPDRAQVDAFASYLIAIEDYAIACHSVQMKGPIPAFDGRITYTLQPHNDAFRKRARSRAQDGDADLLATCEHICAHHADYANLINLLAAFAFYSGVGSKTGQGFGMVRSLP